LSPEWEHVGFLDRTSVAKDPATLLMNFEAVFKLFLSNEVKI
jgi:hypothetical protein